MKTFVYKGKGQIRVETALLTKGEPVSTDDDALIYTMEHTPGVEEVKEAPKDEPKPKNDRS